METATLLLELQRIMIARGGFSIAVANLAVASGVEATLGSLAVAYVFLLAVIGPVAVRIAEPIADALARRSQVRDPHTTKEET